MNRGFGVAASIENDFIAPLALAAEQAGFSTFWVNDVDGKSGLEQLARAQEVTSTIRLGVGVMPIDRWTTDLIISEVERLELDPARLYLGIGAGALHTGSLEAVRSAILDLKSRITARVLVGALGPKMVALSGELADGPVLSWLTPSSAVDLAGIARDAAKAAGRPEPAVIMYMRTAVAEAATLRLEEESARYDGYPAYARHFARMGVKAIDTTAFGDRAAIEATYGKYDPAIDEVVCRAITATESLDAYLEILHEAAPQVAQ